MERRRDRRSEIRYQADGRSEGDAFSGDRLRLEAKAEIRGTKDDRFARMMDDEEPEVGDWMSDGS